MPHWCKFSRNPCQSCILRWIDLNRKKEDNTISLLIPVSYAFVIVTDKLIPASCQCKNTLPPGIQLNINKIHIHLEGVLSELKSSLPFLKHTSFPTTLPAKVKIWIISSLNHYQHCHHPTCFFLAGICLSSHRYLTANPWQSPLMRMLISCCLALFVMLWSAKQ